MKRAVLYTVGLLFSTLPVAACTLSYFPLWRERGGGAVLSGATLILLLLCLVPFYKSLKMLLRSPAAHTLWLILFILFFALSKIAEEMTVIAFVGFLGNLCGAVFFKLARVRTDKDEK